MENSKKTEEQKKSTEGSNKGPTFDKKKVDTNKKPETKKH